MRRVPWMLVAVAAVLAAGRPPARAQALADPVLGKAVNVRVVAGTVRVRNRGSSKVVELGSARRISVGSTVDTRLGTVELTSAAGNNGSTQSGRVSDGVFVVSQSESNPLTVLSLRGGHLASCPTQASGAADRVHHRRLSVRVHGLFRTRGRNGAATARGTTWTMKDSCSGTLTVVHRGTVDVRDFAKHSTVAVPAGRSYTARPAGAQTSHTDAAGGT